MSKFAIFVTLLVVASAVISMSSAEPGNPSGGVASAMSAKNVRILSPAAGRLYRMLRRGQLDDDDLFTEDENNFKKRQYDDYGHLRFGKRTAPKDFDDYGHLRFGR